MSPRLFLPILASLALAACGHESADCAGGRCAEGESCTGCADEGASAQDEDCTGCGGEAHDVGTIRSPTQAADIETALGRADPTGKYGAGLSLETETAISTILGDPEAFEGQRIRVRGEAVDVCAKRGCWIELKSDAPFQSLRVKVADGEIVFPMSAKGRVVVAEGVLQRVVIPVEDLRKSMAAAAAERGEVFDPDSVTGPRILWQLRGLGASIGA